MVHKFRLRSGVPSSPTLGAAAVIAFDAVAYFLTFSSISSWVAWGLVALSVLALALLWRGHWVASRPTLTLEARGLKIAMGRVIRCRVSWSAIGTAESVTPDSAPDPDTTKDYMNLSSPLMPNVVLRLREAADVQLPLDMRKRVMCIAFSLDAAESAIQEFRARNHSSD